MNIGHQGNGSEGWSGAARNGSASNGVSRPAAKALSLADAERFFTRRDRPVLITGGAGFVGANVAHRLLGLGNEVVLFDNITRPGVERNIRWLKRLHGKRVRLKMADMRNDEALRAAVREAGCVFHFAAQVAVTTSLDNPIEDFEVNARGTLNLLEAIRHCDRPVPILFTSTNKVYGNLNDLPLRRNGHRYEPIDPTIRTTGIDETLLDFHSPYGCSKGAADQYVLDYARTFDLPAVVFRMSCIYGPRQMGTEDQGWIAHFLIRAIQGEPLNIYGDGRQVRDVLFVEDLVNAMLLAQSNMDGLSGRAFNIGGGPTNTISLVELIDLIGELHGEKPVTRFEPWRPGDQRYYVSDTGRFQRATGWSSRVGVREGVARLYEWLLRTRGEPAARDRETGVGSLKSEVSGQGSEVGS